MPSEQYVVLLLFATIFLAKIGGDYVPEDLLTDNEEQLQHWKQGNLIDSIRNQLAFLSGSKEKEEADQPAKDSPTSEKAREADKDSPTVHLKSILPSPSRFRSADTKIMSLSRPSNESMTQSVTRNSTAVLGSLALKPTEALTNTSIVFSRNVSSSQNWSATSTIVKSTTNVSLVTRVNHHGSMLSLLVSSLNLSATPVLISSSPAPHSSRVILDTAQRTVVSFSTSFSNVKSTVPRIKGTGLSKSRTVSTALESSPTVRMPALPDEKGYGWYVPDAVKNEKGVGFVYVNVLLPIASGVVGALLISIAILLFRCCRRRKLKKVRYFGRKQQRDFVQLDRMNLLTDTSDEDDFD